MEQRKVIVSHMIGRQMEGTHRLKYALEPQGEATFHQFGVGYEEFEAGPGNFTTAVVEWPDGRVESVPVEHVRFVTSNAGSNGPSGVAAKVALTTMLGG